MKKVLVAMSGGVDSSTAALMLKKQGYEVAGVFFRMHKNYQEPEKKAKMLAKQTGIPLHIIDVSKDFRKKIIKYFLDGCKKGLTPNPCVVCNREIKFNFLFAKLKEFKYDYIATGHYAINKKSRIFEAKDKTKDQSYFLWKLNQKMLNKILFPNGDFTKKEIQLIAKKQGLSSWDAAESQDICFRVKFNKKPGQIRDTKGNIIGKHEGLWFYTIGQRKGIGLAGGPYHVIGKNIKNNILIVSKEEKDLLKKEVRFEDFNWLSNKKPKFPLKVRAKIRYRHESASGMIKNKRYFVFDKPQRAVTPGQSIVFYLPAGRQVRAKEMLGGGIISP